MVFRRHDVIRNLEQIQTYSSKNIAEGGIRFLIPTGLLFGQLSAMQTMGHQSNQAEESQETRRCTFDSPIRPMALGAETEEGPHLLESDLDVPAQDEPFDNLLSGDSSGLNRRVRLA